jgi:2-iminobutanoate/2-iminopropanoate deaminase
VILEAAGSRLENVVKATVFLVNMDDFAAMNEVYMKFFPTNFPARSTIEASRLPVNALVEIELVASLD